jgi:hypothetical protein
LERKLLSTKFGKGLIFMWRFIETNAAAMGTLNDCAAPIIGGVPAVSWSKSIYRPERLPRAGAIETSTSQEIDATRVSVPRHFGHSKVSKSKPGLSGSMIRNAITSPHFEQRGLSITSMYTVYSPDKQIHHWTRFAQILCSDGDGSLEK